jgi:proteasome accessory factor B
MSSQRTGQTRRPLARIHVIHGELEAERYPNCSTLADQLEVSTKTIQRDLDFMRDEFGMPLEFVPEKNGYRYTTRVEAFPPVQIGMEELMALFVARKVLAPMAGSAVEAALRRGFTRLSEQAAGQVKISWSDLDRSFSIHESGVMATDLTLIEVLSTALVKRRKMFFRYTNAKNNRTKARTVRPLHLAQVKGGWYLFAWDEDAKDIRIFALPRIREPEVLEDTFTEPADFNLGDYLKGSMGLITEPDAPEQSVVIRFTGYAAILAAERVWHDSQSTEKQEDGSLLLTLHLQHLDSLPGWILGWGGLAEVLEPASLRKEVAKQARKMARIHQGEPE